MGQMNDRGLKSSGSSATIGASTEQRIEPEHVQMQNISRKHST